MKNVKNTENRIAAMLKAKGWTQAQLARKLGECAISAVLDNRKNISTE